MCVIKIYHLFYNLITKLSAFLFGFSYLDFFGARIFGYHIRIYFGSTALGVALLWVRAHL